MTTSLGLRGNEGLICKLNIGVAAPVDYGGDVKDYRLTPEDKDDADLTFEEAASGAGKDYKFTITAIQSTVAASLWRYLYTNPAADIVCILAPHGNAVATADKPHISMTLRSDGLPELGLPASRQKTRGDFEYEFDVIAGPLLVTA